MASLLAAFVTGAAAGVASIPHCAAMCGPLSAYACGPSPRPAVALRYLLGRLLSYSVAGAIVGSLGHWLTADLSTAWSQALLSWSLAAALAFAAWRLWQPRRVRRPPVVPLHPARKKPGVVDRMIALVPKEPLVFGLLTGLLPCGALAAALVLAASSATALGGATVMLAFCLTSAVALIGVQWVVARLRAMRRPISLRLVSVAFMVGAAVLVVRPVGALSGEPDAPCHVEAR